MKTILETDRYTVQAYGLEPTILITDRATTQVQVAIGRDAHELQSATPKNLDEMLANQAARWDGVRQ